MSGFLSGFSNINLWGGGKKKDPVKDAIEKLNEQSELLEKRMKYLEGKANEDHATAKKMLQANNKNGAKNALKQKQKHEAEIEKTSQQLSNIQDLTSSLHQQLLNKEIYNTNRVAASAMKHLANGMTSDKVDEQMDEMRDHIAVHNEIASAITQPLFAEDPEQDEAAMEEFDELMNEVNAEKQSAQDAATKNLEGQLASAPAAPVRSQKTQENDIDEEEEEEFRRMREDMMPSSLAA